MYVIIKPPKGNTNSQKQPDGSLKQLPTSRPEQGGKEATVTPLKHKNRRTIHSEF